MHDDAFPRAPGGWGYRPGLLLVDSSVPAAQWLPELPLLRMLRGKDKNAAVVEALRASLPREQLRQIRQRDLTTKYALANSSAHSILVSIRGNTP